MDIKKVAQLARLHISDTEEKTYKEQMEEILRYFSELSSVETNKVEPLVTPSEIEQIFREDKREVLQTIEEALQNAPERMGNLFKVPPVV
ncbi:MAG: hypothetical protein A2Z20_05910 [Bdellovibrionales bacterium RBG_16_40_8]|nr:MAG: hypothetical protein A2Z20_05910 [Bdellovibrionales bacterium RBG_16_40_8]